MIADSFEKVMGLLLNITFGFCVGDVSATLSSGLENPVEWTFTVLAGAMQRLVIWSWAVLTQFSTGEPPLD